jgi:formate hydrogenlyase subunit 3/multisubunit Na+/H+ antiporter MnhD subunit
VKGVCFEMLLFARFFLNAFLVIAVPLALVFLAVHFNIIENAWIENTIWIITVAVLLFIAYINAIFEAFFTKYWYQIFQKAEQENE